MNNLFINAALNMVDEKVKEKIGSAIILTKKKKN